MRKGCEGSPARRLRGGEVIGVYKVGTAAVGLVDQRQNPIGGALALHPHWSSEHQNDSEKDPRLNQKMLETQLDHNWKIEGKEFSILLYFCTF